MGERYLVTGVQLGLLIVTQDDKRRKKITDEILDKQFVGSTKNTDVQLDAKRLSKLI